MYIGLSEDSVVFKLGSSDSWAVGGNEDQSGLSSSESSDGVSVTNLEFSGFNDEVKLGVNVLFLFFLWHGQIVPIGNIDLPICSLAKGKI